MFELHAAMTGAVLLKGTTNDFILQISLFSTLADNFAFLKTPPMYSLVYQSSPAEMKYLVNGSQILTV